MNEIALLPDVSEPKKPFWRPWKWIGLLCFATALLLGRWLPGLVVFLGYAYGIVVISLVLWRGFFLLRERLFWRVRNRILGLFIFVGLIPLLLILGTIFLAGYLLVGQLAGNYLETSLQIMEYQISFIGNEVAEQISSKLPAELEAVIPGHLASHSSQFPVLSARLLHQQSNGSFEIIWKFDPKGILPSGEAYPAEKWLTDGKMYRGMIRLYRQAFITSVRPIPRLKGYFLDVSAPLDTNIERRLLEEKSIYVIFEGIGSTRVHSSDREFTVSVDEDKTKNASAEKSDAVPDITRRMEELNLKRRDDKRRMVVWWTVLRAKDFTTGRDFPAGFAVIHVPLVTLYDTYFRGAYNQGKVLFILIGILASLFLLVELVSVVIGATISRRITKSIDDMYRGILAIQSGDFRQRIPTRKNDQLGLLAHSFNRMTDAIVRLMEEVTEKKRLEQELEIAREVQATLFPKQLPKPRGMAIFGGCEPARTVSGDYYDFIVEDEARLHIVVGDISGKGISAALLMANLQAAMRNQLMAVRPGTSDEFGKRLAEVMNRLNEQIYLNSPSEKYVTLFASRYDAELRQLFYCNAGHLPPILMHNGSVQRLETGGTVLGLFPSVSYQADSVQLAPGTLMAIFTDGVTEAVNDNDEEFGEERLLSALQECRTLPPEAIYRHVTGKVQAWQGAQKQRDDITLIIAHVD